MESTFSILLNYLREFIPANKGHVIAVGISSITIGVAIWLTAHTSGLHGDLTYLAFAPGTSLPAILVGLVLIGAAVMMKLPPADFDRNKPH
ncbi:MAG: hypothetical protein WC314_16450 [Vulcanimicrobiota bacterium]